MISEVYGIYDLAAECFIQTLPCQNDAVARMTFTKLFKDKRLNIPMIYDYPNLYQVSKIAKFDDNKGLFENYDNPELFLNFGSIDETNKELTSV